MFQRAAMLWRQNEAMMRLGLLVLGIAALTVEAAFPTKAMLAWREAVDVQSVSFMSVLMLVAVGGCVLAGILAYKKLRWGIEGLLILMFFIMSVPFAPLYWTVIQAVALGVGLGFLYRFNR